MWRLVLLFAVGASGLLVVSAVDKPSYRLPDNVVPKHYILDITTDLDEFTFEGKVWIKVQCLNDTDTITLHVRSLNITKDEVKVDHIISEEEAEQMEIFSQQTMPENEFYVIKLAQGLVAGKNYIIHMPFHGILTEGLAGYYRSSYFDRMSNTTKWLAVTQFESTDARRAFPCFDEPAMKAKFTINLGHKENLKSASNMPIKNTVPINGRPGWVWDHYEDTVPMSTYLVAFLVCEFEFRTSEESANHVLFRVWARKDAINQVEFARKVGPKFLEYYEQYFDVKYPLPKQDMVAIPDFHAGAMENWGLITYREAALLFDEKSSSVGSLFNIAMVIAHELAHQWFGNLVTMKWWTDLWLNEGFATYMAYIAVHNQFPEWNSIEGTTAENLLTVYSSDSLKSSHPVSVPIGHPNEIAQIFDTISYKKGAYLLHMMNCFLSEQVFRMGVSNYLKKHHYSNAEQNDLWDSLTEEAHRTGVLSKDMSVKEIMDTWTVQTGYPLVTVNRSYDKEVATVTQTRYLAVKPESDAEQEKSCWSIPLSYTTQKEADFKNTMPKYWLTCKESLTEIKIHARENEWVILNVNAAGLFRIQYDEKNWQLLASALNSNEFKKIGVLNRVQLVADSLDLAWRGDLNYSLAFDILKYLRHEDKYLPWKAGLNSLSNIDRLLRRTPNYGLFKKYVQNLLTPIFEKVGKMTDVPKLYEDIKHKYLITSWACRLEVGDCAEQASNLFQKWRAEKDPDTTNPIPTDLRSVVYCVGIKTGGQDAWEFLWERYKKSNVGNEQNVILSSLGCSREVWILNRYLEWSIDPMVIRRQDSSTVFYSVVHSDMGYYLAKNFLFKNIKRIYEFYGIKSSRLGRYITGVATPMISEDDLKELQEFGKANEEYLKYSSLVLRQSIETVTVNTKWYKDNYNTIINLISAYY